MSAVSATRTRRSASHAEAAISASCSRWTSVRWTTGRRPASESASSAAASATTRRAGQRQRPRRSSASARSFTTRSTSRQTTVWTSSAATTTAAVARIRASPVAVIESIPLRYIPLDGHPESWPSTAASWGCWTWPSPPASRSRPAQGRGLPEGVDRAVAPLADRGGVAVGAARLAWRPRVGAGAGCRPGAGPPVQRRPRGCGRPPPRPHGGRPPRPRGAARGREQPVEAEQLDVVAGRPALGQVGHDLADHAGELEPVPGAGRGERHLGMVGVQVDDEVLVRGVGEQARHQRHRRAVPGREVAGGELAEQLLVLEARLAVEQVGVAGLLEMVVLAELEPGHPEHREAVEAALVDEEVEDREPV